MNSILSSSEFSLRDSKTETKDLSTHARKEAPEKKTKNKPKQKKTSF
jgi:hypothetical protein